MSVPLRVFAGKNVDSSVIAGDTQQRGVLVEVDTVRAEERGVGEGGEGRVERGGGRWGESRKRWKEMKAERDGKRRGRDEGRVRREGGKHARIHVKGREST